MSYLTMMKSIIFVTIALLVGFCAASPLSAIRAHDDNIINTVNSANAGWVAAASPRFVNHTLADVAHLCGVLEPSLEQKKVIDEAMEITSEVSDDIPASFNSIDAFTFCNDTIAVISDQANCGSCWAVSAAKVLTDRTCIASKGQNLMQLSAQDLMACCKLCGRGCNGGIPMMAMMYFKLVGLVTGGEYNSNVGCVPYSLAPCDHSRTDPKTACSKNTAPTPSCQKSCVSSYTAKTYAADKHKASTFSVVTGGVAAIQTEIIARGPVQATLTVYADFPSYKTGVYSHVTGDALGGHAVTITGWGSDNGHDYWLVANSWNTTWGENGYFRIKRGTNECGIEGGIYAPKI